MDFDQTTKLNISGTTKNYTFVKNESTTNRKL